MNNKTTSILVVVVSVLMLIGMGAMWMYFGWMPRQSSNLAPVVDKPFYFVLWAGAILTVGVVVTMLRFMLRFLRKKEDQEAEAVPPSHKLELTMALLPTILVLVVFTWGFKAFMHVTQPPKNAYEIKVKARKWAWDFEYPTGYISTNELYVPSNRPIRLLMSSDDVLHSFWVPEFRVKHDVIPNRYSTVWFEATNETGAPETPGDPNATGYIRILCTEYCGAGHSGMLAKIWVLPQDQFDEWLSEGGGVAEDMPLADLGAMLYQQKACNGCHSTDGTPGVGPSFQGIYGSSGTFADGTTIDSKDENYIRESILVPAAKIVEGYQPVMPPIPLSDREVDGLIEFMKQQ